jgi:hypothetical protein
MVLSTIFLNTLSWTLDNCMDSTRSPPYRNPLASLEQMTTAFCIRCEGKPTNDINTIVTFKLWLYVCVRRSDLMLFLTFPRDRTHISATFGADK